MQGLAFQRTIRSGSEEPGCWLAQRISSLESETPMSGHPDSQGKWQIHELGDLSYSGYKFQRLGGQAIPVTRAVDLVGTLGNRGHVPQTEVALLTPSQLAPLGSASK